MSIVSARDKDLADLKEIMKTCEQVYYNMGFKDAENQTNTVVLQVRRFEFAEGWMAAVNAIGCPDPFTFRDPYQIPLLDDLFVKVWTQEQPQDGSDEEGKDNPSIAELAQQIDSHMVVIDEGNSTTTIPTERQGTAHVGQGLAPPIASEVSFMTLTLTQDLTT